LPESLFTGETKIGHQKTIYTPIKRRFFLCMYIAYLCGRSFSAISNLRAEKDASTSQFRKKHIFKAQNASISFRMLYMYENRLLELKITISAVYGHPAIRILA
jgi:hypothetical protein